MKRFLTIILVLCLYQIKTQAAITITGVGQNTTTICPGVSSGKAWVNFSGNVGCVEVRWINSSSVMVDRDTVCLPGASDTVYNLPADGYLVVVKDLANGNQDNSTVLFSNTPAMVIVTNSVILPSCFDTCDGAVDIGVFGGGAPYTYAWSGGATSQDVSSLCSATHRVTVTDNNSCTKTDSFAVISPAAVGMNFTTTNPTCNGTCDGVITAAGTGGTPPYLFDWGGTPNGDGTGTITGLCATTLGTAYTLTLTDAHGCPGESSAIIAQPTAINVGNTITHVVCNGGTTGSISLLVTGGVLPYTYTWSPNVSATNTASSLAAGTYDITVTDNGGAGTCPQTLSLVVTQPAPLLANLDSVGILCFGQSTGIAYSTPSGGTAPYGYEWSTSSTNDSITGLATGTYDITVTDFNFCTVTASIMVDQNPQLLANASAVDITCHGFTDGTATSAPSGGVSPYLYTWSEGSNTQTINSLGAGTYFLTVTDNVACTALDTVTVSEPAAFSINFISSDVTCNGANDGTASVAPSGGTTPYAYDWTESGISFSNSNAVSNLPASGAYVVGITDASGCPVGFAFSITEPTAILPNITHTDLRCFGDCNALAVSTASGGNPGLKTYLWSTGDVTPMISSLCEGTYDLTVTDPAGCTGAQSITVIEPPLLNSGISGTDATCSNCDGQGSVNVSGGVVPYNLLWGTGESTNNVMGLCPGYAYVTITDDSLCTLTDSVLINTPGAITINPSQTNVTCNGANDGIASVAPTGGLPGYGYLWSNGATLSSTSGLSAGIYTVTITDSQPCVFTYDFTITESSPLSVDITQNSASCANICNGSVTADAVGGIAPFDYIWDTGDITPTLNGLCLGSYNVTVTDANGCSASASVTVTPQIVLNFGTGLVKIDCNDAVCDGSASAGVSGGASPYTFTWSAGIPNQVTPDSSVTDSVCSGYVVVTAMDLTGCTGVDSVLVPADPTVLQVTNDPIDITCNGFDDGQISTDVLGGTAPYSYAWTTGEITPSISNLPSGTYTVTVTDQNLCSVTATSTINEPITLDITATPIDVSCHGANDGSITTLTTGGTAPHTYEWNTSDITPDLASLTAGTYTVTVTDVNLCTAEVSAIIIEPATLSNSFTNTMTSCNGGCDGTSMANPTGGVAPYDYQWDINTFFQTTQTATALCEGSYDLTILDANGCSFTSTSTITEPSATIVGITTTDVTCFGNNNGIIQATPAGGTAPYTYLWDDGLSQTSQTATGLMPGTYNVTVSDANGCPSYGSGVIAEPANLTLDVDSVNVSCFGDGDGVLTAFVGGGVLPYDYAWNDPTSSTIQQVTGLDPGTYSVTVTDANGCFIVDSSTVLTPTQLQGSPSSNAANCALNDGTATVNPLTGGTPLYTHSWSNGSTLPILTNIPGGLVYTDTITDGRGCKLIVQVPVSEIGGASSATVVSSNITCEGNCDGTANVVGVVGGTAPYSYIWNDPLATATSDVTDLCSGSYLVQIDDNVGCTYFPPAVNISEPSPITDNVILVNTSCSTTNNGSITTNPTGGNPPYSYSWNTGDNTSSIINLASGAYSLTITDNSGCTNTFGYTINNAPGLISSVNTPDIDCYGENTGFATVNVIGGTAPYTYVWDVNAGSQTTATATGLSAGTYSVTFTDANGCSNNTSATIDENPMLSLTATVTNTTCGNSTGDITVVVGGGLPGYSYLWINNGQVTPSISGLSANIYSVQITDAASCIDTFSIVVTNTDGPIISSTVTNVSCFGSADGSASVSAVGGVAPYSYEWTPDGQTTTSISGQAAGDYFIKVTDQNLCVSIDTVTISEPNQIQIDFISSNVSCNGVPDGSISANPSLGVVPYSYQWSNGANTQFISNLSAGIYTVTVTDGNGCTSTDSASIIEPSILSVLSTAQDVTCNGLSDGSISLTVSGGAPVYTYLWNDEQKTPTISTLAPGNYLYTVTDQNGCSFNSSATINEPSAINVVSGVTNTVCGSCIGSITNVASGGTGSYSYSWSVGGSITADANNLCAGAYDLTVTDANDCFLVTHFAVNNNDGPSITLVNDTLDCFGNNDGVLVAVTSGGGAPYTYLWNDLAAQTTATASNLTAGTYQIVASDTANCTAIAIAEVVQPTPLNISYTATDPDCNTNCDAQATLTVSGGEAPYSFIWPAAAANQITQTAIDLCAASYVVTVNDNNNCISMKTVDVIDASSLNLTLTSSNISCFGNGDGFAQVVVSGGSPAYTYQWSNNSNSPFISALNAGTQYITVTDQTGCTRVDSVDITEPSLLNLSTVGVDLACNGIPTGSAIATPSGGTPGYVYNWSPSGSTNQTATALSAGTQYVTVTDNGGCIKTDSVTLNQPVAMTVDTSAILPNCTASDGSLIVTPSGGVAPYTYLWSANAGSQTDSIADNIGSGSYSVTVTDNLGCSVFLTYVLNNSNGSNVTLHVTDVSCGHIDNGSISSTVIGGTAPHSYFWSTGESTPSISNLVANVYSLSVTDANGCETIVSDTVFNSTSLTASSIVQGVTCNSVNDGSIALTISGGSPGYTYTWSPLVGNGATVSNLTVGTYYVTVDDAGSCSYIDSFVVGGVPPISITAVITNNSCHADSTGSVVITAAGGVAPYNYTWSNGDLDNNLNQVPSGSYNVHITDASTCFLDSTFVLTQPTAVSIVQNNTLPNCNQSDGEIQVSASGGTGTTYTYAWSGGQITPTISNLNVGLYQLTITDSLSCEFSFATLLSNFNGPVVTLTTQDITCGNTDDGSITSSVAGGTPGYTYSWSNGEATPDIDSLVAGDYILMVTDVNGCVGLAMDTVFNSNGLSVTATVQNVSCNSTNDGSISLSVSGGTPAYTYTWFPIATVFPSLSNLTAGTYYVTVNDAGSCSYIDSFAITAASPISITAAITNNTCFGDSTASVVVTASGGNAPYSFDWSNGDADNNLNNVPAGTYTVHINDATTCTLDSSFTLTQPTAVTINQNNTLPSCLQSDGEIQVTPSGGLGTVYTYIWSGGVASGQVTPIVSGLNAGVYLLTVTDSLSCSFPFSIALSNLNGPTTTLTITNETCFGDSNGTATATVSSGTPPYDYLWFNGDTINSVDSLPAGIINLMVTDSNGCMTVVEDTINPGTIISVATSVLDIACNGANSGQITLTPSNGNGSYTYNWSPIPNGTAVLGSIPVGTYYYTVTDSLGCFTQDSAVVGTVPNLLVDVNVDSIYCFGNFGSIDLVVSGGNSPYTYNWSDGSMNSSLAGLVAGTYSVTITDASACSIDTTVTLLSPAGISVSFTLSKPTCLLNDGSITAVPSGGSGGYSFAWGGQAAGQINPTANNLFAAIYPLTITDGNACTFIDSVALSNVTGPVLALDSLRNVSCYGLTDGYIYITATSIDTPLVYTWSSGQITDDITNLLAGAYDVAVTDTSGCITLAIYNISTPDSFYVSITGSDVSCFSLCDGSALAEVTGGTTPYLYAWDDTQSQITANATGLCTDTFNVVVTDSNLCTTTSQIIINEPTEVIIALDLLVDAVCSQSNDGSISITASGGTGGTYQYAWTGPNGYTSILEDQTNLYAGSYTLIVSDSNNCQATGDTIIKAITTVTIDSLKASDTLLCENEGLVTLNGHTTGTSLTYNWTLNGTSLSTSNSFVNDPNVGTSYYVLSISHNACTDKDSIKVVVEASPVAEAGTASDVIAGLCKELGGTPTGPSGSTYNWSPNVELTSITGANPQACPKITTLYYLTVTSANGCISKDSVLITVLPEIDFIGGFTPNGDGINDGWVINNLKDFPDVVVEIFNRWGQLLYTSAPGYQVPWDGTYNGKPLPVGTYYYVINLNNPKFPDPIIGPLTIVR